MAMASNGQTFFLSQAAFSKENTHGFSQPPCTKKPPAASLVPRALRSSTSLLGVEFPSARTRRVIGAQTDAKLGATTQLVCYGLHRLGGVWVIRLHRLQAVHPRSLAG